MADHRNKEPTCLVRGLGFAELAQAIRAGRSTLFTLNVMHMRLLRDDSEFQESYRQASLVTLDSNLLNTYFFKKRMRVATGSDFVRFLGRNASLADQSIVVVGNVSAMQAARVVAGRHVAVINPGWGFMQDAGAVADIIARCRALKPDVIFIAVGAPRSEKLALKLRQAGVSEPSILCCGAAFEFELGMQTRSPRALQAVGLEWIWRLCSDPRRLGTRYISDARFLVSIMGQLRRVASSGTLLVGGLRLIFQIERADGAVDASVVSLDA